MVYENWYLDVDEHIKFSKAFSFSRKMFVSQSHTSNQLETQINIVRFESARVDLLSRNWRFDLLANLYTHTKDQANSSLAFEQLNESNLGQTGLNWESAAT